MRARATAERSLARVAARQRRPADALPHDLRALELFQRGRSPAWAATALNAVGWHTHISASTPWPSTTASARALHEKLGDPHGHAATLDSLGYAHRRLGQYGHAIRCYRRSLALFRSVGDRYQEADTLTYLGDAYATAGEPAAAHDAWREALAILTDLRHPDAARSPIGSARRQPLWQSCDTARTRPGHPAAIVVVMNTLLKRGAVIAAFSVLALTAACDAKEDTASTAPKRDAAPAAEGAGTDQKASRKDGAPAKVVTAAELPDLKKLAACMNQQGVATAEPAVGKPFDTAAMDAAFGGPDQAKFERSWRTALTTRSSSSASADLALRFECDPCGRIRTAALRAGGSPAPAPSGRPLRRPGHQLAPRRA